MAALAGLMLWAGTAAHAQLSNPLSTRVINYKTVFDDPYDINQLWVNLSPISAYAGSDNVSLGYGVSARLFVKSKLQFTGSFHSNYAPGTDLMRTNAKQNASVHLLPVGERHDAVYKQVNTFIPFSLVELGVQYAISDVEKRSTSRIMLTSKKVRVMEFTNVDEISVNSRNRHIWGVRLGGQSYGSTVSLNKPMERQGAILTTDNGTQLTAQGQTLSEGNASTKYRNQLYSNLRVAAVTVGGSYQLIRNVAIKADKFGNLANNIIVSTFADVMVAPSPMLDDVRIARATGGYDTYSTKGLAVRKLGFRTGFDVSYNQDLHYSFGAEMGVRPGLQSQGFYVAARVSFPALAFRLNRSRLANQVNAAQ